MYIITILRITGIVCFQRRRKGTLEGLEPSVCCSRGRKKEQCPSIPDCTGRNDKGSMVDTRWPNHDEVQAVTAVKRLRRKRVAVYPLHTFVEVCSWCVPAPNNYTGRNAPCVWPILAAARSEGWHLPDKIIIIMCTIYITVKE
jgi:hypothetical protein